MSTPVVTPTQARRIAIEVQGLAAHRRETDVMGVAERLRCIQFDPINAVARTQLLVLFSRLGAFDPKDLERLVFEERSMFSYWAHAASFVLTDDYPIHSHMMKTWPRDKGKWAVQAAAWLDEHKPVQRYIMRELELKAGWVEFVSRRWLWILVMYFGFFHIIFIAPVSVLGPAVADASLGGASAWATIATAGGIGGILALHIRPERTAFVVSAIGFLLVPVLVALAIPAPVWMIAAGEFPAGGTFAYGGTLWDTTMQEQIPRNMLSRVSAYDWLGSTLLLPVGTIAAGALGVSIGFGPTLIGGAILLVVSTAAVMLVKDVRELRRPTAPVKEVQM